MSTIGRPREFDRDDALHKAMELFWERGYEATGMRDLLEHMGIGRQSLYDTFVDKRGLYVEAVKHYNAAVTQCIIDQLNTAGSPVANLRRMFADFAEKLTDGRRRGCLLTNTLVELGPHDEEVAAAARTILGRIENAFRKSLDRAVELGELPEDTNVRALARYFTSTIQGMAVMAKSSASRAAVRDVANVSLSVLEK